MTVCTKTNDGPRLTCDAPHCPALATRITTHTRPNTGVLQAYWCDEHYPVTNDKKDQP